MRSRAQAVPCHPCSPASILVSLRLRRCASAFFAASQNSRLPLRQRLMQSQEMSSRAAASSSVSLGRIVVADNMQLEPGGDLFIDLAQEGRWLLVVINCFVHET